jgi:hypothetical protein
MEEFGRLQTREFWIMEQDVRWTKRLEQSNGCNPPFVHRGYGQWSPRQHVQEPQCGLEQLRMGFQGSRHEWQGTVYQQPLTIGVQRWKIEPFVGVAESTYRPRGVGGWAGRPESYRKEECRGYSAPNLRRAADYPSRQLAKPMVGRFGLPLSTVDHPTQQGSEHLDYEEYEEGTNPNVFLRAFEKVRRANGVADDLQIITIFSLFLLDKVLLWHDCYMNDHPDCSWTELKRAFCKRYGGEPGRSKLPWRKE